MQSAVESESDVCVPVLQPYGAGRALRGERMTPLIERDSELGESGCRVTVEWLQSGCRISVEWL